MAHLWCKKLVLVTQLLLNIWTSDPCDGFECDDGYECKVFEDEAYCDPNCDLNPCEEGEECEILDVLCAKAPCPGILNCAPAGRLMFTLWDTGFINMHPQFPCKR